MTKKRSFIKALSLLLIIAVVFSFPVIPVTAANNTTEIKLVVNGETITPEVPPQIINNRTMVPIRFIAEALGNTVEWDKDKRIVLVDSSSNKIDESVDPTIRLFVAGKEITPDVPPQIINGRAMVPVRFVAEALGAEVGWDSKTNTVTINKTSERYGYVRRIKKQGKVALELEPDELFVFISDHRVYKENEKSCERFIGQYIREAFPDLKFKIVTWDDHGFREEDFVDNGVYPDIYMQLPYRNTTRIIKTWGMDYDLTPLIEKYNVDLGRFNKASMNIILDRGAGAIYSLPFEINEYILYYNKKFFDMRNEPYPEIGMTYDEAFEKAQRMTFQNGFNQIKGYTQHPDQYLKLNQLGLMPFSLTEPNKVVLYTDEWLNLSENIRRFYKIGGNVWNTTDDFAMYGVAAMCVDAMDDMPYLATIEDYIAEDDYQWWTTNKDYNQNRTYKVPSEWDISSMPVLDSAPDTIYQPNLHGWFITKQSQLKETAFQVINYLLTDDVQKRRAADGAKGVVKTDEIAAAFGTNVPEYKNLNLKAVYWGENAVPPVRAPEIAGGGYWDIALWAVFRKYIFQYGLDTEIALQRVEKEENQWIQDRIAEGLSYN